VVRRRGVDLREDVRAPLRALADGERESLAAAVERWLPSS
jgi:hypothetical protein